MCGGVEEEYREAGGGGYKKSTGLPGGIAVWLSASGVGSRGMRGVGVGVASIHPREDSISRAE